LATMPKTAIKAIWKDRPLAHQMGRATPQRYVYAAAMTLSLIHLQKDVGKLCFTSGYDLIIDLHPTREHRRTRQPSSDRSIGDHEHLRLIRVFGKVSLLDPDSNKNDTAEEDRKATDDAVAIGLGEEFDSHLVRKCADLACRVNYDNKKSPSQATRYILIVDLCQINF
jgi:hypothetical protein